MAARKAAKAAAALPARGGAGGKRRAGAADDDDDDDDDDDGAPDAVVKQECPRLGRRTAAIWAKYKATSIIGEFECQEIMDATTGKVCGDLLHPGGGPTALWSHHRGKHKNSYRTWLTWHGSFSAARHPRLASNTFSRWRASYTATSRRHRGTTLSSTPSSPLRTLSEA